jgi:predicted AAA+ superfamily ATPase
VSVLQASGQIVLLEPWHVSFGKRVVKTPKVYFRDSGLLCFLLGLDASTLLTSPALGAVWETFVFAEMRKLNEAESAPVNFWYYRDQRGQEVDFVRDAGGVLGFMECKWSERPTLRDARGLVRVSAGLAASNTPWRPGPHYVIGRPVSSHSLGEGVAAVALRDLPGIVAGKPPA